MPRAKKSSQSGTPNGKATNRVAKKHKVIAPSRPPEEWAGYTSRSIPVNLTPGVPNLTADHVVGREVEWLLEPYIPYGFLTLLTGESEAGKSTLLGALTAAMTQGRDLLTGTRGPAGKVLVFSPEEDPSIHLMPRWEAHEADISKIVLGDYGPDQQLLHRMQLPAEARQLGRCVSTHGVRLVIIDPITSYLAGAAERLDDIGVRNLLDSVQSIAQETGCAVVITRHPRKQRDGTALDRVAGSAAWTQHPRVVLATGRDPEAEDVRVLACGKNSFRMNVPSLEFRLNVVGGGVQCQINGQSKLTAKDIGAESSDAAQRDAITEATAFLTETLREGPLPQKDIKRLADENGISWATLRRAKVKMKVTSHPIGANGQRYQEWRPPAVTEPEGGV